MNTYILITPEKMRLVLNDQEYKQLGEAVKRGAKFVMIQKCLISLAITPSVTPFDIWYANENEKLAVSGKRLCKLCLGVMQDVCACWPETGKADKKNAFKHPELPQSVKDFLLPKVEKTHFPEINQADLDRDKYLS